MTNLRLATPAEKIERDRLTAAVWGDKLTVEQYLAREARLRAQPFAARSMRTWLLEDDTGVLASCETFATDALVGGLPAGQVHAVASVFTEEARRGRGHASTMMRALLASLAKDPQAIASTLYSDVGPDIYARVGYHPRPAFDRWLPSAKIPHRVELVADHELSRLLPQFDPIGADELTIRPTEDLIDWHIERERAYAALIAGPRAACAGAVVPGGAAAWVADAKKNQLYVLFATAETVPAMRALFDAAVSVAAEAGLGGVRVWETPAIAGANVGVRSPRDGSIPMIALLPRGADLAVTAWRAIPRLTWV